MSWYKINLDLFVVVFLNHIFYLHIRIFYPHTVFLDQTKAACDIVRGQDKHQAGGFDTDLDKNYQSWENVF